MRGRSHCMPTFDPPWWPNRGGNRGGITSTNGRGRANVFCPVEPKAGRHFTFPNAGSIGLRIRPHRQPMRMAIPKAETIHPVLDNLNILPQVVDGCFGVQVGSRIWERFTMRFTPRHRSWLNQAEIEIGLFSRQCLGSRRIPDLNTLRRQSSAWNRCINDRIQINWKFDPQNCSSTNSATNENVSSGA
jgi:DDE superfamily endonuclease